MDNLKSTNPIIAQALKSKSFVEQFAQSDLSSSQSKTLLFAQKIMNRSDAIGVLILRFKFEDEMHRIFNSLLTQEENIFFTDGKDIITSSTKNSIPLRNINTKIESSYFIEKENLFTAATTKGYEGYFGAPWKSVAYTNIHKATQKAASILESEYKCTLDANIKSIIAKADDVIEDLSDVIINGELIASKERVYVLTPVLDNLRTVSTSILNTIKETVINLENTIMDSLIYEAKASAKLAIEIMDRNLYERANDCRWWALTPVFIEELSHSEINTKNITQLLQYINGLYTVYTNLIVYDLQGKIVASSNDSSAVGKTISGDFISKTLRNHDSNNYFVSPFEKTPFYNDEPTYIYNASICSNSKNVGGIGIVFDAIPQFKAILNDSFPHGKNGFSCIVDRVGMIVATNNPNFECLQKMDLTDEILKYNGAEAVHKFIVYQGVNYLVGVALSQGYREYKRQDNYKNDLLSLTFIIY